MSVIKDAVELDDKIHLIVACSLFVFYFVGLIVIGLSVGE